MDTSSLRASASDRRLALAFRAIIGLAAIGIVLRFVALDLQSLWVDELHTLRNANPGEDLGTLLRGYMIEEQSPPLYFLLLHFWLKLLGVSELFMRLPSAIFGAVTVGVAALFAKPHLDRKPFHLFVAFLACSYGAIYYAQEARPYSLLLLAATAMTVATLVAARRIESDRRTPLQPIVLLSLFGLLGSFTHYFGIIVCGACLATLLLLAISRKAPWWPIVVAGLVVLALFAPWVVYQAPKMTTAFANMAIWNALTPGNVVHALAWFAKLLLGNFVSAGLFVCLFLFAALGGGVKGLRQVPFAVGFGVLVLGFLFALLVSLQQPIISGRNLIILMPAAFLAFAQVIGSGLSDRQFAIAVPLCLVPFLFGSLYDYYEPHKQQWREAATFISEQSGCDSGRIAVVGDPWGIEKGDTHHFRHYLPETFQVDFRSRDKFATADELWSWVTADSCPIALWVAGKSRQEFAAILADLGWSETKITTKGFVGAHLILERTVPEQLGPSGLPTKSRILDPGVCGSAKALIPPKSSKMANKQKFIFVCGLHRSGTTLLAKVITRSPSIGSVIDAGISDIEGQYLQTVYPIEAFHGGPGRMGFSPAAHLTEESPLVTEENRQKLFHEWQRFCDPESAFIVEKTPANLLKTRFLQALYPDSYFIVLTRHPIAVAMATQKWAGTGLFSSVAHWVACHEIFEADRPHLSRVLKVTYEDFTENHETVVSAIADFVGIEPWDPQLKPKRDVNARYFERWKTIRASYEDRFEDSETLLRTFQEQSRALCERQQAGKIDPENFNRGLSAALEEVWRATHIKGQMTARPSRALGRQVRKRTEGWFDGPGFQIVDGGAEARDAVAHFEDRVLRLGYSLNLP